MHLYHITSHTMQIRLTVLQKELRGEGKGEAGEARGLSWVLPAVYESHGYNRT